MLTGLTVKDDAAVLTAAHIWPTRQAQSPFLKAFRLTEEDVDSPRNGLLLLSAIEQAFDRKQLCFIHNPFKVYTIQSVCYYRLIVF